MTTADRPTPGPTGRAATPFTPDPASFLAVAGALEAIRDAVDSAEAGTAATTGGGAGAEDVLASLLLLRQLREQLAVWEPGLVETAREAGASWAELAHPLGVSSRQAAERRYLRNRPGASGTTGEQRVQATRERRAADRDRTAWARRNAADLRRLATSPVISVQDKRKGLEAIADKAKFDAVTRNFLGLLAQNGRAADLPGAIAAFEALYARHAGIVAAEVTSAKPLAAKQMTAVKAALKGALGRDPELTARVDPSILGGIKVKVGSKLFDASLKTKLDQMNYALKRA